MNKDEKELKEAVSTIKGAHDKYIKSVMLITKKYNKKDEVLEYIKNNKPSYSELLEFISSFNPDIPK